MICRLRPSRWKARFSAAILLIEKLKVQIARLKRMQFGRSLQKLATEIAQLELGREELETAQAGLPPRIYRRRADDANSVVAVQYSAQR
jgi:hypothetical protein